MEKLVVFPLNNDTEILIKGLKENKLYQVSGSVRQDFQQGRKLLAISIFYIDCRDSKRNPRGDGACTG